MLNSQRQSAVAAPDEKVFEKKEKEKATVKTDVHKHTHRQWRSLSERRSVATTSCVTSLP